MVTVVKLKSLGVNSITGASSGPVHLDCRLLLRVVSIFLFLILNDFRSYPECRDWRAVEALDSVTVSEKSCPGAVSLSGLKLQLVLSRAGVR